MLQILFILPITLTWIMIFFLQEVKWVQWCPFPTVFCRSRLVEWQDFTSHDWGVALSTLSLSCGMLHSYQISSAKVWSWFLYDMSYQRSLTDKNRWVCWVMMLNVCRTAECLYLILMNPFNTHDVRLSWSTVILRQQIKSEQTSDWCLILIRPLTAVLTTHPSDSMVSMVTGPSIPLQYCVGLTIVNCHTYV